MVIYTGPLHDLEVGDMYHRISRCLYDFPDKEWTFQASETFSVSGEMSINQNLHHLCSDYRLLTEEEKYELRGTFVASKFGIL